MARVIGLPGSRSRFSRLRSGPCWTLLTTSEDLLPNLGLVRLTIPSGLFFSKGPFLFAISLYFYRGHCQDFDAVCCANLVRNLDGLCLKRYMNCPASSRMSWRSWSGIWPVLIVRIMSSSASSLNTSASFIGSITMLTHIYLFICPCISSVSSNIPSGHIVKEEAQQTLARGDHGLDTDLWSGLTLFYGKECVHQTALGGQVFIIIVTYIPNWK